MDDGRVVAGPVAGEAYVDRVTATACGWAGWLAGPAVGPGAGDRLHPAIKIEPARMRTNRFTPLSTEESGITA